jgi:DMATS type aromatic prenyltransferase
VKSSHVTREEISRKTLAEFGRERLSALCEAAGAPSRDVCQLFTRMIMPWGERRIGKIPSYRSNIADDEAPFEFSMAFSGGAPEVQFYVEAMGEPPDLLSNMPAGRALLNAVAHDLSAPLERLKVIEDLFFPTQPRGAFTSWTGVSCASGRPPRLKVYLNPQVNGLGAALGVTAEAMRRLGLGVPWAKVHGALVSSGQRFDEISILSLDLSDAEDARAKVYVRHHGAGVRDLQAFASTAAEYHPDDVRAFYTALADGEGPFLRKPPITEMTFTTTSLSGPSLVTLEFPIGSYVGSDEVARHRIAGCMTGFGLSSELYEAAVQAFATRPLPQRAGMHAHVTLRRQADRPRLAVYLASEAYLSDANRLLEDADGTH